MANSKQCSYVSTTCVLSVYTIYFYKYNGYGHIKYG